jgi:hypothetical protein
LLVLLLCISRKQWKLPVSKYLSLLLVFLFIQLFVINAAWYFTGTFILFGNYPFESATLQALQASSTILKRIPMLLPAPFVQGIDMLKHHAEIGGCKPESTYGGVWLFDRVWCNQPVWYYYLATSLFKFPLFTWALSIGSVVLFLMQSARGSLIRKYMFVWVPFLFFLLILSFFNKFQIGIRHALVLLPFLYLLLSSSIIYFSRNYKLVFFTLLIFHTISVLNYLPNLIAYTNELIRDKKNAYHIIRDSSLDYGQGKPWIRKFIEAHPGYKTPGNLPDTGKFVISVADLFAEHNGEKNNIAWLRNHFNASGHYRYSLLLFNVSATGLREKGLCPRYK